jgi:uncharacterized protein (TIGR02145 family)
MKKSILFLFFTFIVSSIYSQSTIITPGGTNESINIKGANSGIVSSGITTGERDAIINPKDGQLIYNKTTKCFEFYNGSYWFNLCENDDLKATKSLFTVETSGLQVSFKNSSQKALSYFWTFGNGQTSTLANPIINYPDVGTYTVTLTATNSIGSNSSSQTFTVTNSTNIHTDIDGNSYNTITLGTNKWMKENLKTTKYSNGDLIPNPNSSAWSGLTSAAWCYYDNNASNNAVYGKLYNFFVVEDTKNVCPIGWHVPTDAEWKALERYLGMTQTQADAELWRGTNQGSILSGTALLWQAGNLKSNAQFGTSGFNAIPAGFRYISGVFGYLGTGSFFWTSTVTDGSNSVVRNLYFENTDVLRYSDFKTGGRSIRCVK